MGNTFLSHKLGNCIGSVVLDASPSAKLIAPSFSINSHGIGSLTLDIQIAPGGKLEPSFWCIKCGATIEKDKVGEELTALCQVCGVAHPVSELSVHSHITTICSDCLESIKGFTRFGGDCDERIKDYVEMYSLTKNIKVVSLVQVLNSPITI